MSPDSALRVGGSSDEVLRRRARELATPARSEDDEGTEVLKFVAAGEPYVVPLADLAEVVPGGPLARVPHAPDPLLGVATLRGSLLPVVALGPSDPDQPHPTWLLAFGEGPDRLAIAADGVTGTARLHVQEVLDADLDEPAEAPVVGLTRDGAGVLDAGLLLTSDRFTVAPSGTPRTDHR